MKKSLTKVSHQKELVECHFRSGKKNLQMKNTKKQLSTFHFFTNLYQQRISTRKT